MLVRGTKPTRTKADTLQKHLLMFVIIDDGNISIETRVDLPLIKELRDRITIPCVCYLNLGLTLVRRPQKRKTCEGEKHQCDMPCHIGASRPRKPVYFQWKRGLRLFLPVRHLCFTYNSHYLPGFAAVVCLTCHPWDATALHDVTYQKHLATVSVSECPQ